MKVKELILDNCQATCLTGLSDQFESLETFKLTDAGLTTLKGFPKLTNLKKVSDAYLVFLKVFLYNFKLNIL